MKAKPLYKLRQLIYKKYGKEKFAIGCLIVARWVQFETKKNTPVQKVQGWCNKVNIEELPIMSLKEFKAISKLFGLNNDLDTFYNK
ncbi:MAG: hypothetical protein IT251_03520 [Chitinophagaceae bacterium]|nr:hypothetical protein [Chitinophagaceae bacterium]